MLTLNDLLNLLKPQHLENVLRQAQKDVSLFHWIHELCFINNFFWVQSFFWKKMAMSFLPQAFAETVVINEIFFLQFGIAKVQIYVRLTSRKPTRDNSLFF